jgi:Fe-S oxidoreductase
MEKTPAISDPLETRIKNLTDQDLETIKKVFLDHFHSDYAAYLSTCAHCGLCAESCHYYLTDPSPESIPAHKLNLINKVFRRNYTLQGRILPGLSSSEDLSREMVSRWVDSLFGRCTLCGRCAINCTMGINIFAIIRTARTALSAVGLTPDGLQSTVDTAVRTGNNMGISKQDWLETVEWLEEELQMEVEDDSARLPLDKKGTRLLYTINPREAMFFPMSISAVGKIFYAARESWTFSSENFDVTNYGLYNGDDDAAGLMSERLIKAKEELECEQLILAECGHGYNSNRWEAPDWLSRKYGFPVFSIIEVIGDYIRSGRIRLDPSKNTKTYTLHDPCNLVRLGGIIEEQRFVLKKAVQNFVEMTPNREKNYCCGGGGGQLAMTRFAKRRLSTGRIKAEQIQQTGAGVVVTPCHNCIDQLMELNKHYKLNVEIKTVSEVVADALVLDKPGVATDGDT